MTEQQEIAPDSDLTVEEFHPELVEASSENKIMKKLPKLTEKILKRLNGRINADRDIVRKKLDSALQNLQASVDKFVQDNNKRLTDFEKRYQAMYSDIVHRVLLKMEKRVYTSEIFNQASLDLCVEEILKLKEQIAALDSSSVPNKEEFIKTCAERHQALMEEIQRKFVEKMKEKENAAIQEQEKANLSGADQSDDSGAEESSSDEDSSGSGRAEDARDSESVESGA